MELKEWWKDLVEELEEDIELASASLRTPKR